MTLTRFLRWATVVLGLACIASVVAWWGVLGWNPSLETLRESTPYGHAVTALTLLVWLAYCGYSAAARRGP